MDKRDNQTKPNLDTTSSNWKLIIILLTIFTSFIVGWIIYLVKKSSLEDSDRRTCKIVLWVFTILEVLGVVLIVVLAVVLFSTVHGLVPDNNFASALALIC
jgi:amino acid transporter